MDLPIPGTNSPQSTAGIFADNVQNFLGTGLLQIHPTATIVVNSIDDALNSSPSVTTLRDAINKANADKSEDLIVFDRSLFSTAQTITLSGTELDITNRLDIVAPRDTLTGGDLVTVSGNNRSRVFEIGTGATVNINGLIVADGNTFRAGGISNSGTLTLNSSIVRNNHTTTIFVGGVPPLSLGSSSGGISNSGTLTVNNSTISGNSATADGGGIYNSAGTLKVNNSTISGNSATLFGNRFPTARGGGIYNGNGGTSTIQNSTISGNSADQNGGGIYNGNGGTSTIQNSTISGNRADSGGGIYNDYTSTLTLLFNTVTQNQAANGGGVYQNDVSPYSSATRGSNNVRNTIIAANLNSTGGINPDVSGTFTSLGYNLIGDSTGSTGFGVTGDIVGTSANPIDPLLAPLAFNGGPTQTIALLPNSPAINAGDPTVLPTDPKTDQRGNGNPRVRRGRADIGAFESSLKK